MLRETINIGEHKFICDYIDNSELVGVNNVKEFDMLRSLVIKNERITEAEAFIYEHGDDLSVYPVLNEQEHYVNTLDSFLQINNKSVYSFYDKNGNIKKLKYDVVRLYHPMTYVNNIKLVVHLYFVLNDKKFHFICKQYNEQPTHAEKEIQIGNETYCEYIEFHIPNLDDLLSKSTYFIEDTCKCGIGQNNSNYIFYKDDNAYCSMYLNYLPYVYTSTVNVIKNYILSSEISKPPINVTLFPYDIVDQNTYLLSKTMDANTETFCNNPNMTLYSKLVFDNIGKLSLLVSFDYNSNENLSTYYQKYNNVDFNDYDNIVYDSSDEREDYDQNGNLLEKQYQIGYIIEYASDTAFKNIIYRSKFVEDLTLFNDVTERYFEIPLFNNWDQKPEILICRVTFIDRYIGNIIQSNYTVITEDYYKYLVTYDDRKIYSIKFEEMQDKFINNVKCVVKKENNNTNISIPASAPKVIYKPVFYKVQDLQNIQLHAGVTQNVGINLSSYMAKVEAFNLVIEDQRVIEHARNDVYVIFKIQSNRLTGTSGKYHICNQDEEYISSGNWSII